MVLGCFIKNCLWHDARWQNFAMTQPSNKSAQPAADLAIIPAEGYAGDIAPQTAARWVDLKEAVLIDVRTDAEREWVGYVPGAVSVAWKQWPGMALNDGFDNAIRAAVPQGKKAVLLCRSGVRSIAAARRATQLGIEAYNILEGFEGDPDGSGHRGLSGGWRFHGLPWKQN